VLPDSKKFDVTKTREKKFLSEQACTGLAAAEHPNRRRSPGGVAEAHPSVAGRQSRVLMAEHRGQLAKTQNSMRAPSSTTRFGGMLKKSVAALALRAMKLNRRLRHRIIGAGPVDKSCALPR